MLKMPAISTKREVREAILDATERLLARYGYRKMTVEDIAREVGVGKGSIYLHFDSKEEIVLSHVDRIVDRVKESLWTIARSKSTAAERIKLMLLSRVLIRFDSIQLYTQSLDDMLAALRPGLLARRAVYFDEEAQIFAQVLTEGRESHELKFDDALTTAYGMLHATNSLLPYSLSTTELGEREDVKEKARVIANLILQGLLERSPGE
jgi:AcrR family transcriptional regulator